MIRILAIALLVFAVAAGLVFTLSDNARTGLVESPVATSSLEASPAAAGYSFDATGVIDYSPNNAGTMIPYLVYQDSWGNTATKALMFCNVPSGHYTGSVHVTGVIEEAGVCVDSISAA